MRSLTASRPRAVAAPRPLLAAAIVSALLVTAVPAVASANVPDALTRTNEIVHANGAGVGTLTTEVSYTDPAAAATATADAILLEPGGTYRLKTCVAFHAEGSAPVSRCVDRHADTRGSTGAVASEAAPVTLSGQLRPADGGRFAYFTAYVQVDQLVGDRYVMAAHSWPAGGLQGAGIPVAPASRSAGALPANAALALDGPFNGAVNTGQPDSICTPAAAPSSGVAPSPGVVTTHPAFADASSPYEVGHPADGGEPVGVMLVIHGGAWALTGPGALETVRADADRWRARGWETVNVGQGGCAQSLDAVLWFHDRARAWYGLPTPICAIGISAGGHLALMLAALRPNVYCVISEAGPSDLTTLPAQAAFDDATGTADQTNLPRYAAGMAAAAFGRENLASLSPVAHAARLVSTRVLQGVAATDPLISFQQAAELRQAMLAASPAAYVDTVQLAPGPVRLFVHGGVSQAALDDFHAREDLLVGPIARAPVPPPAIAAPGAGPRALAAPPVTSAATPRAAVALVSGGATVRRGGATRIRLRCSNGSGRCAGRLTFKRRSRGSGGLLAVKAFTLPASSTRTVALELTRTARRLLARGHGRLVVRVAAATAINRAERTMTLRTRARRVPGR